MTKYGVFRVYNNTPLLLAKFESEDRAESFAKSCKSDKPLLYLMVGELDD